MLQELSLRLARAAEQKRLKGKLEQDLHAVQAELQEKSAQLASLSTQLAKEKVDVEKLERTSLTALFYSVLGSREEQLEKERQELLSAQLRYQQVKHQVEFLQREKDTVQARLDQLQKIDFEYEMLLAEKEGLLRQSRQTVAKKLIESAEQVAQLRAKGSEIAEAINAGKDVLPGLERVIRALEDAQGWGTWDLLGGGLITTAMKHSGIDEARREVHEVQSRMSRFQRELSDVQKDMDLEIDISEFATFADFFFDGLIVDWVVQSKINDSLERSKQARDIIAQTVKQLEDVQTSTQEKIKNLQEKRAQLIEGAQ